MNSNPTTLKPGEPSARSSTKRNIWPVGLAVLAVGFGAVALARSEPADAKAKTETIEFDVAEDGTRFVFDEAPVFDDGLPAYGNAFVTQGYIYEAGAVADGAGVNGDGSATHPELVIGTWTCEGHFIGDGANTETGAWVVSKQVFDLGDQPGAEQIVTEGLELVDHDVAGLRPIVGGTGKYRSATGEQTQVLHGHNESEGVQLSITLSVDTPKTR